MQSEVTEWFVDQSRNGGDRSLNAAPDKRPDRCQCQYNL